MSTPMEILLLGAEGSGKTLLIRRVKEFLDGKNSNSSKISDLEPKKFEKSENLMNNTIPTVGMDLSHVRIDHKDFLLRELGSSISQR